MKRSAPEVVILVLTFATGFLIVASGIAMILTFLFRPAEDVSAIASGLADLINTIVGALIGYLAGTNVAAKKARDDQVPPAAPPKD